MTDSVNAERQTQMLMSRHILKLKRHVNTQKEEPSFGFQFLRDRLKVA